jgi:hypothetical protein
MLRTIPSRAAPAPRAVPRRGAPTSKKFSPRMHADERRCSRDRQRHQANHPAATKFLSTFIRGKILLPSAPTSQASPTTGAALHATRPARLRNPQTYQRPPGPVPRHSRANSPPQPVRPERRTIAAPLSVFPPSPAPRGEPTHLSASPSRPARKANLPAATRTPRAPPAPNHSAGRASHAVRHPASARRNPYAQRNLPSPNNPARRATRAVRQPVSARRNAVRPEKPRLAPAASPRAPRPPRWILLPAHATRPRPRASNGNRQTRPTRRRARGRRYRPA